jgi:hypothetical protein
MGVFVLAIRSQWGALDSKPCFKVRVFFTCSPIVRPVQPDKPMLEISADNSSKVRVR